MTKTPLNLLGSKPETKVMELNKRIENLMKDKGISQKNFQTQGLKQSYISRLLKGEIKRPTLLMCQKIAKTLDVTIERLLSGTTCQNLLSDSNLTQETFCPNPNCPKAYIIKWNQSLSDPRRFSIARFDSAGNENKFCPTCGTKMVFECDKCHKPIQDPYQIHCMGCGKELFKPIAKVKQE